MLTTDILENIENNKKKESIKSIKIIYSNIEKEIEKNNKLGNKNLAYQIPICLPNKPYYDITECIKYITSTFKHNGFDCEILNGNFIIISWRK
jgi:hypothetical protein